VRYLDVLILATFDLTPPAGRSAAVDAWSSARLVGTPHNIARHIREQIASGEFPPGTELPTLEELSYRYYASVPTIRQALMILEWAGLVTVRRGRHGGSVVRPLTPFELARPMELALLSEKVPPEDTTATLWQLIAMCAGLCADRADRDESVLPVLISAANGAFESVDLDPARWHGVVQTFHLGLIRLCGNRTLTLLGEALDWTVTRRRKELNEAPFRRSGVRRRLRVIDDHTDLLYSIHHGEPTVARQTFAHLSYGGCGLL
jgi:DNA-binding FadR family transcriptional regulator